MRFLELKLLQVFWYQNGRGTLAQCESFSHAETDKYDMVVASHEAEMRQIQAGGGLVFRKHCRVFVSRRCIVG